MVPQSKVSYQSCKCKVLLKPKHNCCQVSVRNLMVSLPKADPTVALGCPLGTSAALQEFSWFVWSNEKHDGLFVAPTNGDIHGSNPNHLRGACHCLCPELGLCGVQKVDIFAAFSNARFSLDFWGWTAGWWLSTAWSQVRCAFRASSQVLRCPPWQAAAPLKVVYALPIQWLRRMVWLLPVVWEHRVFKCFYLELKFILTSLFPCFENIKV